MNSMVRSIQEMDKIRFSKMKKILPVTFGYFIAWKYIPAVLVLTSGNTCIFRAIMKFIVYTRQPRMGICTIKRGKSVKKIFYLIEF